VSTTASREDSDKHKDVNGKVLYGEAVSSFMYLAATTRPDIAFAVNEAARSMGRPADKYWINFKRIIRYL